MEVASSAQTQSRQDGTVAALCPVHILVALCIEAMLAPCIAETAMVLKTVFRDAGDGPKSISVPSLIVLTAVL